MYDLTALREEHQKMFAEIVDSPFISDAVTEQLYAVYLELKNHPRRDWNRPAVTDALSVVVDRVALKQARASERESVLSVLKPTAGQIADRQKAEIRQAARLDERSKVISENP